MPPISDTKATLEPSGILGINSPSKISLAFGYIFNKLIKNIDAMIKISNPKIDFI